MCAGQGRPDHFPQREANPGRPVPHGPLLPDQRTLSPSREDAGVPRRQGESPQISEFLSQTFRQSPGVNNAHPLGLFHTVPEIASLQK